MVASAMRSLPPLEMLKSSKWMSLKYGGVEKYGGAEKLVYQLK